MFKDAMQQFVTEYSGRRRRTEDWKASKTDAEVAEPRTTASWTGSSMSMSTGPSCHTMSSDRISLIDADGVTFVHLKLSQSNVSKNFVMRISAHPPVTDRRRAEMW